jgi:hypothetical protein
MHSRHAARHADRAVADGAKCRPIDFLPGDGTGHEASSANSVVAASIIQAPRRSGTTPPTPARAGSISRGVRSRLLLEPGPPGDSEGPAGEVRVAIGGLSKTAIDGRVTVGPDRLRSKRGKGKMACGGDPRRHGKVVPDCAAMMSRKDSRQALQPWYRAIGAAD